MSHLRILFGFTTVECFKNKKTRIFNGHYGSRVMTLRVADVFTTAIEVAIKIPSSHVENLIFIISIVVNTIQIHQIEAK